MSLLKSAKWHPLVSFSPPHILHKAVKSMAKLISSLVVNCSQLSPCQGDMQSFEGDPDISGHLTSLRKKTQQKQPGQLSASIPG